MTLVKTPSKYLNQQKRPAGNKPINAIAGCQLKWCHLLMAGLFYSFFSAYSRFSGQAGQRVEVKNKDHGQPYKNNGLRNRETTAFTKNIVPKKDNAKHYPNREK